MSEKEQRISLEERARAAADVDAMLRARAEMARDILVRSPWLIPFEEIDISHGDIAIAEGFRFFTEMHDLRLISACACADSDLGVSAAFSDLPGLHRVLQEKLPECPTCKTVRSYRVKPV